MNELLLIRARYTDFLVNEITPDGKVVHLTTLAPPKKPQPANAPAEASKVEEPPAKVEEVKAPEVAAPAPTPAVAPEVAAAEFALTSEDEALLHGYFGADVTAKIVKMYKHILSKPNEKAAVYGSVVSEPILDRELRTKLHQDMRRIFNSKLETSTDKDGYIKIFAAAKQRAPGPRGDMYANQKQPRNQQKGKLGWAELGGEHLHFSLYKENKDTMEVISYVSMRLGMKPRAFSFAGTKDRRGVTVQRVSTFRKNADQLAFLNRDMRGSRIGDFTYEKHGLELGDLTGNEFLITLRDCQFPGAENLDDAAKVEYAKKVVGESVKSIQTHGFLNYFGLQRFGTYLIGTDEIGRFILNGDFKGAVDAILSYSHECLSAGSNPDFVTSDAKPVSRDDIARAQAIKIFKDTGRAKDALEKLPRKFSAESVIMKHLERNDRKTDYMGAILQINRNLRLMYVHAYQSLVWNHAVSKRWEMAGDKVTEGDLVLIDKDAEKPAVEELDQNGEIVILPAADDAAVREEDMFERARSLSAEEAASGKFTIFDIVLPTPGYDVEYPKNALFDFYKEFMASERGGKLDPENMRRPQKDFSLSGSYRKMMASIGKECSFEIKPYKDESEQFVKTDLEKILEKPKAERNPAGAAAYRARQEAAEAAKKAEAEKNGEVEMKDVGEAQAGDKRVAEEQLTKEEEEPKEEEKRTKIAVIVKLQLGSSQYATMALRELMKEGGVVTYKPDFSSGR